MSGLKPAAWLDTVPAANDGAKPSAQFEPIAKLEEGVASGPDSGADQGIKSDVVVNVPHACGVASSPRSPPKNLSFSSLNGSCGFSLNTPVICPVSGFVLSSPGIFTSVPVFGSSITM